MGPDRLRRLHRSGSGYAGPGGAGDRDGVDVNPVDQLQDWRSRRVEEFDPGADTEHIAFIGHGDTVEFPAVQADGPYRPASEAAWTETLPETYRRRRLPARPGAGLLVGGGLVAAALLLSGLAALGVGPVRDLLGSGHDGTSTQNTTSGGNGTSDSASEDRDRSQAHREANAGDSASGGATSHTAVPSTSGTAGPPAVPGTDRAPNGADGAGPGGGGPADGAPRAGAPAAPSGLPAGPGGNNAPAPPG